MVRETRHLWVGNLPDNIREERIREHFKRYGRVQSVKLLSPRQGVGVVKDEASCEGSLACTVAFMDIKSASKAHTAEHKIDDRALTTEYYEPAAIPSTAATAGGPTATDSSRSPQQPVAQAYSPAAVAGSTAGTTTSPVPGGRFPNGHGTPEDHAQFADRFFDRRSSGYRGGRERDRTSAATYRNGPPYVSASGPSTPGGGAAVTSTDVAQRGAHGRGVNSWTAYDSSSRYNSSQPIDLPSGYTPAASTPTVDSAIERRTASSSASASSDAATPKKKAASKSSGSRSPSPVVAAPPVAPTAVVGCGASSRSPSRTSTRSRSSSASSDSSTSRATSSTVGSPKNRRLASSGSASSAHQPVVHTEDRRPLAICVRNLPLRSSDTSLKDGLFHEYKKHGKVTWVKVVGQSAERHAVVCFKKPEDAEKALEVSHDKMFFGSKIEVAPYQGYDVDDNDLRPYEAEIDEFHPKATRTLFIGNLEKDVTASDLRKHFDQFGEIIEIDIKKQGAVSSYAFCQYSDIVSVVKAIRSMDGEHLGNNRVKLGFGKSMPTNCVWVDGVSETVNEKYLTMQFDPFGSVSQVMLDREKGQALVFYEQVASAQAAVGKMRGAALRGRRAQVDFASRECQEAFRERAEKLEREREKAGAGFEERRSSEAATAGRGFERAGFAAMARFTG